MRIFVILSAVLLSFSDTTVKAAPPVADFPRAFHIAGIPEVKRDQRVDITFAAGGLLLEHGKVAYRVPYARIKQALLLDGERNYEKTAEGAGVAAGAVGVPMAGILILAKHKVDTVVVDYENERGGRMGLAVQLEKGQGQRFGTMMKDRGVVVSNPPAAQKKDSKPQPKSRPEVKH